MIFTEMKKLILKIVNGVFSRLTRYVRFILILLKGSSIKINGFIDLSESVKCGVTQGGIVYLSGPIWCHRFVSLQADGGILRIGKNTSIGPYTMINSFSEIEIGENCMIAEFVTIRDHDHRFSEPELAMRNQGWSIAPITIGNNVWLGSKVTITKGCRIGDNVIIGANSVVTKDIPANSMAVGSPAKVIKKIY